MDKLSGVKQPKATLTSQFIETFRSLFRMSPTPSVETIDTMSAQEIRGWAFGLPEAVTGNKCAVVLSKEKHSLTVFLVDAENEFLFDAKGIRIAKQFKFSALAPDLDGLIGDDEIVVLAF